MPAAKRVMYAVLCLLVLTAFSDARAHGSHGHPLKVEHTESTWKVQDGMVTFYFYEDLLASYGITLTDVRKIGDDPGEPPRMRFDPPWCGLAGDRVGRSGNLDVTLLDPSNKKSGISFDITEESDFTFRVLDGALSNLGLLKGTIRCDGGLTFAVEGTDSHLDMQDFVLEFAHIANNTPGDIDHYVFQIRDGVEGSPFIVDAGDPMAIFMGTYKVLILGYHDVVIRKEFAKALGRPGLAGKMLARAEVQAHVVPAQSSEFHDMTYTPKFMQDEGDTLDVLLGFLMHMTEMGREGDYPDGVSALAMLTLACNKGNVDVPWEAPMDEDHPGIVQQFYREKDTGSYTKFEMIGYADIKHAFFALSNSDCDPCQHPSDGTFLGVGCSDAYGTGNNSDPTWLAPRYEWNPWTATWECTGSHFSGGMPDCIRRHGGGGHGPIEHRLATLDSDMDNPNSSYYFEAMYIVKDDMFRMNSIGSKGCTMTWDGAGWDFTDDGPLILGPALLRWDADLHTWAQIGTDDGQVLLSSKATDLGGGLFHYEYALLNFDSHRRVRSVAIPVDQAGSVTNIEFHDGDRFPENDWTMTLTDDFVTHETVTFEEDSTGALMFMTMVNFRFDADGPPEVSTARLGIHRPGDPMEVLAQAVAPATPTSVEDIPDVQRMVRLLPSRPNPLNLPTAVRFELGETKPVKLFVYDAAGRRVRTLVDRVLSAGPHTLAWDGTASDGHRLSSGVYFYLLKVDGETARQSVVIIQ